MLQLSSAGRAHIVGLQNRSCRMVEGSGNAQGNASGRAEPMRMRQHGTQGSSFRRSQVFGFMLCLHLLESFNNFEAGEIALLVKCLLHKRETWSSTYNTHIKMPGVGWRGDSVVKICTRASDRHSFCSQACPIVL